MNLSVDFEGLGGTAVFNHYYYSISIPLTAMYLFHMLVHVFRCSMDSFPCLFAPPGVGTGKCMI